MSGSTQLGSYPAFRSAASSNSSSSSSSSAAHPRVARDVVRRGVPAIETTSSQTVSEGPSPSAPLPPIPRPSRRAAARRIADRSLNRVAVTRCRSLVWAGRWSNGSATRASVLCVANRARVVSSPHWLPTLQLEHAPGPRYESRLKCIARLGVSVAQCVKQRAAAMFAVRLLVRAQRELYAPAQRSHPKRLR